jgi:HAMP domain-containing protein
MKSIFSFKNASLLQKIIFPLILSYLVSLAAFIYLFNYMSNKDAEDNLREGLQMVNGELEKSYEAIREKSLMAATAIAYNPQVVKAYETYYTTYDLDSSVQWIGNTVGQIAGSLEKSFGYPVRIHFHAPPGISFYRSWVDKRGDDLTAFRKTLNELFITEEPVSGIESGRGGFVIRGIHPIYDENNTVLGSVEVYFPIDELMKNIYLSEKDKSGILILKSTQELMMEEELGNNFAPVFDDFYSMDEKTNQIEFKLLSNQKLLDALQSPVYERSGNYGFLLKPIVSFQDKAEGLIVYQMDLSHILNHYSRLQWMVGLLLGAFFLLSAFFMAYISKKNVASPINQIIKILNGLAKGEHNRRMKIKSQDEIGMIKKAINHLIENLINIEHFAHQIGEGKYNVTFKPRSEKDSLAYALISMKENLQKAREESEIRRNEEKKREWQTKGVSDIYETLRAFSKSSDDLFYHIIGKLVKYINANQGGIFILDGSKEYLELKGCYAYDRNRYMQKKAHVKEGLIGRCFQEKEFINLSDIPNNYLKIVSGVGEKSPDHLLLVPLLHDEEVKGIIELAAFHPFEEHIVTFVQEVCRQLSSALNDIEYSERTQRLLDESKEKENRLVQQEEEMRQNMEELQATQEQLVRKQEDIRSMTQDLANQKISMDEFIAKINTF